MMAAPLAATAILDFDKDVPHPTTKNHAVGQTNNQLNENKKGVLMDECGSVAQFQRVLVFGGHGWQNKKKDVPTTNDIEQVVDEGRKYGNEHQQDACLMENTLVVRDFGQKCKQGVAENYPYFLKKNIVDGGDTENVQTLGVGWALSSKSRNKAAHCYNGNPPFDDYFDDILCEYAKKDKKWSEDKKVKLLQLLKDIHEALATKLADPTLREVAGHDRSRTSPTVPDLLWEAIEYVHEENEKKKAKLDEPPQPADWEFASPPEVPSAAAGSDTQSDHDKYWTPLPVPAHWLAVQLHQYSESNTAEVMDSTWAERLRAAVSDEDRSFSPVDEYRMTAVVARHLDRYLYPDPTNGMVLHQMPVSKRSSVASRADVVACTGAATPQAFLLASDAKVLVIDRAERETAYYAVDAQAHRQESLVCLGLPFTRQTVKLQLYVPVTSTGSGNRVQLGCITVCEIDWKNSRLPNFLRTVKQACDRVASLTVRQRQVLRAPWPEEEWDPTEIRPLRSTHRVQAATVLLYRGDVYKYTTTEPVTNIPTFNRQVTRVCEGLWRQQYPYIRGNHTPFQVKQFLTVVEQLRKVHRAAIVHSDVRIWNILFTDTYGKLIDWDLAGKVGEAYPDSFARLEERHPKARSGQQRDCVHDWYSLGFIMSKYTTEDVAWKPYVAAMRDGDPGNYEGLAEGTLMRVPERT